MSWRTPGFPLWSRQTKMHGNLLANPLQGEEWKTKPGWLINIVYYITLYTKGLCHCPMIEIVSLKSLNQPEFPMIFHDSPKKHKQTNHTFDGSEIPNNHLACFLETPERNGRNSPYQLVFTPGRPPWSALIALIALAAENVFPRRYIKSAFCNKESGRIWKIYECIM